MMADTGHRVATSTLCFVLKYKNAAFQVYSHIHSPGV